MTPLRFVAIATLSFLAASGFLLLWFAPKDAGWSSPSEPTTTAPKPTARYEPGAASVKVIVPAAPHTSSKATAAIAEAAQKGVDLAATASTGNRTRPLTAAERKALQRASANASQTAPPTPTPALVSPESDDGDKACSSSAKHREAAARMIRLFGYDCAKADSVCPYFFSEGYTVACNHYRYSFEVENHGGKWSVTSR